jgi:hypothetical protein
LMFEILMVNSIAFDWRENLRDITGDSLKLQKYAVCTLYKIMNTEERGEFNKNRWMHSCRKSEHLHNYFKNNFVPLQDDLFHETKDKSVASVSSVKVCCQLSLSLRKWSSKCKPSVRPKQFVESWSEFWHYLLYS